MVVHHRDCSSLWATVILLLTAPSVVRAFAGDAAPNSSSSGKLAIRLVYSENFADLCSAQDSTDLFDVVTAVLPSHRRQLLRQRSLNANAGDSNNSNDCSMECAWIGEGKCTVMKPWLAGPCNDWHSNRRLQASEDSSFLDFLQFQDSSILLDSSIPMLSSSERCVEAVAAVKQVLPHVKAVVTPGCQSIFQHPIEVTCFEGYQE